LQGACRRRSRLPLPGSQPAKLLASDDPDGGKASTLQNPKEDQMPTNDRLDRAREAYRAYESGDRRVLEELLSDDFTFFSPPDPGIDRATYFERCWPNAATIEAYEFTRLVEAGDEVLVTYEARKTDGRRFRNTEVLTFDGDRICTAEVYFGWNLD
jgi:ketosteroid isomerase-like protein